MTTHLPPSSPGPGASWPTASTSSPHPGATTRLKQLAGGCLAQPFFCEENAWLRCRVACRDGLRVSALWITNSRRAVPMWAQRASVGGAPVLWDYHVVAVVAGPPDEGAWVLDPDCVVGEVTSLATWLAASFPIVIPGQEPAFRIVDGQAYVDGFASDRRHMRRADGSFLQPIPPWPPIAPERGSLVEAYLAVDDEALGAWVTLDHVYAALTGLPPRQ